MFFPDSIPSHGNGDEKNKSCMEGRSLLAGWEASSLLFLVTKSAREIIWRSHGCLSKGSHTIQNQGNG